MSSNDSNVLAHLRKESLDIYNRLHSIAEDVAFVDQVHLAYSALPLLPNLRCGAWYTNPASVRVDAPAYFKSTDGHFSNWSFNLRRANLHLLPLVQEYSGIILVDSTRSGKRIPDALSKTIPIWCAVINRAMLQLYSEKDDTWDISLYTPPGAVSKQEHHQIEQRLDTWANALATSSFQIPNLPSPLRPLWITPSTSSFPPLPSIRSPSDSPSFLPVICVSASKQLLHGPERRSSGFAYIQGSGDDHELWGMGLTPKIFWKNYTALLNANRSEVSSLVSSLVSAGVLNTGDATSPSAISKIGGRILICAISNLPQSDDDQYKDDTIAHIFLTPKVVDSPPDLSSTSLSTSVQLILRISIPEGKKGQAYFLHTVLPISMVFIRTHLARGTRICIACDTGKDVSVGVALTALQQFFDDEGSLALDGMPGAPADKKSIRTRLEWIIASRPVTNPSRTTLKRVNEFLLSRESFRTSLV